MDVFCFTTPTAAGFAKFPKSECNPQRGWFCVRGLHVAVRDYIFHGGLNRLVACLCDRCINPLFWGGAHREAL